MSIEDLRKEYKGGHLKAEELGDDPLSAFQHWFDEALKNDLIPEPNAMTLATVDSDGNPSARIVLLKEIQKEGFIFYTNYRSRKSQEILSTEKAALVFWWEPLRRQVRIEGLIEKISEDHSQKYFSSRPRGSQVGAWASDQSAVIESREQLDSKLDEYIRQFGEDPIPKPNHWGGFIVKPHSVEFWQGGERRLHDRIRFRKQEKQENIWTVDRLCP